MQQEKISSSANFITLTYDTKHVPITSNGFMSLSRGTQSHLTHFFKRLRKASTDKISYYAAGEYSPAPKYRPHYHAIIFNARVEDIETAWWYGKIHNGEVTGASVGYTLKYICKPSRIPIHRNDDRIPEFAVMSKGIGLSYLSQNVQEFHKALLLDRCYLPLTDGRKIKMPRYYKDKLYTDSERERIKLAFAEKFDKKRLQIELNEPKFRKIRNDQYLDGIRKMKKDSITRNKTDHEI